MESTVLTVTLFCKSIDVLCGGYQFYCLFVLVGWHLFVHEIQVVKYAKYVVP